MNSDWQTLLQAQAARPDDAWVLLEGQATVEAALAGWWEVAGVLLEDDHPWEIPAWSGLEVRRRPAQELRQLGEPSRHRGLLGLAKVPAETQEVATLAKSLADGGLLVVCPRLSDPGLAGAVTRHAEACGAAGILFGRESASPFDPRAIAASAGAVFRLPVRVADGGVILRGLKAAGVDLTGWEASAAPTGWHPPAGRRALVVGDPGHGLGPFWRAACDRHGDGDWPQLLTSLAAEAG